MPRKRKRRQTQNSVWHAQNNAGPDTIRSALSSDAKLLRLEEFVRYFAPAMDRAELTKHLHDDSLQLSEVWVSPLPKDLMPMKNITKAVTRETLPSLIGDVIWCLVQRRQRLVFGRQNVLALGYVPASDRTPQVQQCPNMRPGVHCTHLNNNVSFCLTSNLFRVLHSILGDDILRMLLLNTRMFLPVNTDNKSTKENFMMICGPPLEGPLPGKFYNSNEKQEQSKRRLSSANSASSLNSSSKRPRLSSNPNDADPNLKPNVAISRKSLFYSNSFVPKVGLPSRHILNGPKNAESLLGVITDLYDKGKGKKRRKRWKRLRDLGIVVCEDIFNRHSKCDYPRLLEHYCPLPKSAQRLANITQSQTGLSLSQLATAFTPPYQVVSFLSSVLKKVFPLQFWGSEHNFNRVLRIVNEFVNLRRREKLPNKALMVGIRVIDVSWLQGNTNKKCKKSRTNHEAVTILMLQTMRWLFRDFIIPLLRSVFYATETEFSGKRVMFYRKPVWTLFRSHSMKKLLTKQYVEIQSKDAITRLQKQRMGFSLLRLLPKATGVRPIATLCKRELVSLNYTTHSFNPGQGLAIDTFSEKTKLLDNKYRSANMILKNAFAAIQYECKRKPHILGAGLFGLHDFYPRYRRLVDAFKKGTAVAKKLYFASVDIHHCYDNIDQDYLLEIVSKVLSEDSYFIQGYQVIHPIASMQKVMKRQKRKVGPPEKFEPLYKSVSDIMSNCRKAVFVNGSSCQFTKKDEILDLLQEHLKQNLVLAKGRYGNRYLLQNTGIPQGSVLSSLFCNSYYGEIEQNLLQSTLFQSSDLNADRKDDGVHLLARIVDDFLLITTDAEVWRKFLQTMHVGDPSLGVQINKQKTCVNADVDIQNDDGTVQKLEDCTRGGSTLFPWCGMLLDTLTGEVRIDYSRFGNGMAGHNLNVDRDGCEGRHFERHMKNFVRPRCLPILFDPSINSSATCMANFYEMMILCAVKTMEYLNSSGMMSAVPNNMGFVLRCIEDMFVHSFKLIENRLQKRNATSPNEFRIADAFYLGWHAFQTSFCCHGEFKELLNQISRKTSESADKSSLGEAFVVGLKGIDLVKNLLPK